KTAMASTDPMTRRFAVACGVLSQYVKANSSQPSTAAPVAQGVSGLMAAAAAAAAAPVVQEPGCEVDGGGQQFTIFYAGKVVVIDRCTPAMAAELMRFASAAQGGGGAPEAPPALVDMPIARKASLKRFLAKRKATPASARSSYVVRAAAAEEEQPPAKKAKAAVERREDWLALGSLGHMHSR
ncbi:Os03g0180800, partial [Oryza sativa Japonica Group]